MGIVKRRAADLKCRLQQEDFKKEIGIQNPKWEEALRKDSRASGGSTHQPGEGPQHS